MNEGCSHLHIRPRGQMPQRTASQQLFCVYGAKHIVSRASSLDLSIRITLQL